MPPPQAAPQPVIPEDEFEQAVPPLDSELDRPLESFDAFEQEQSDGDQREEVAAPPTMVQGGDAGVDVRSEEHTSELQSLMRRQYDVFCLKKKKQHEQRSSNTQVDTSVLYTAATIKTH